MRAIVSTAPGNTSWRGSTKPSFATRAWCRPRSARPLPTRCSSDDKGKNLDIDKSIKDLLKSTGLKDPNSFVSGNPGSPPPPRQQVRSVQKEIRQQERVLLDVFSTTNFMKAGAGVAVVMLFVFIFVIGPPPSDGRCALPWC
mmetsp:Transcript_12557/g.35284  ORF Transcript_12557/g.35284 Transcript_12557/m.35284 type:complete len:142 (-) Transcript_12557:215-640(-)